MQTKVNIIELASELAENELNSFFQGSIYKEFDSGTTYTSEAQEVFNELYDRYYSIIERCAI